MNSPRQILLTGLAALSLLAGRQALAVPTVQVWYHLGEIVNGTATLSTGFIDSSGNGRNTSSAYSHVPWNNPAYGGNVKGIVDEGVGALVSTTGNYNSTSSARLGRWGTMICNTWGTAGSYNPPAKDWFMEVWVQPHGRGFVNGSCWIFSSGQSGGYLLRAVDNGDETSSFVGGVIGGGDVGDPVLVDTNVWTHLAMVNDNGVTTFYVNGVASGASDPDSAAAHPSAGDIYFGNPGAGAGFDGLMDEARICTFAPGTFTTNDFLLRQAGPSILQQPQSVIAWEGGVANFSIKAAFDPTLTYKWRRGGSDIAGAVSPTYQLPGATLADSTATFDCVVTTAGGSVTSAVATLTVVPQKPAADLNAYRDLVRGEAGLVAFFPVDGSTGSTVANVVDATRNGTLEALATYDGATNRAFGERALYFRADGDVQIPANPAFEFTSGKGTIEALVYLSGPAATESTIFAVGADGGDLYYALQASPDGSGLIVSTNTALSATRLTWSVPSLIGRLTHLAVVFDGGKVTPYVDGQPLAAKDLAEFGPGGPGLGAPAWIGAVSATETFFRWLGTIDELAVYNTALSASTIQSHFTKFVYGTTLAPPVIVSQSKGPKTLLAGASPVLNVVAAGALPFTYQWKSNGVPIAGATAASLALTKMPAAAAADFSVTIENVFGAKDSDPIALTFVEPPAGYISRVMNDGPTALWRLAESGGTTATDSAGLNDGTYEGAVAFGQPGIPGETSPAIYLNGSSRALVPLSSSLNPNGPFTVELWANSDDYTPGSTWVNPLSSMDRPGRTGGYEFYLGGNYNGWEWHTAAGGGYNMITGDGTKATPGTWYHVVGVFDGFYIKLYVNGQRASPDFQDDNVTEGTPPFAPNIVTGFYIGSRSDNVRHFKGAMQNVAFYNYALTETQIQDHMSAGMPLQVSLATAANIVPDTKPAGMKHHGQNNTATWVASNTDGASKTRTGVMQFAAASPGQITVPGHADFDSTVGTIMFWMRSAGTVTSSGHSGSLGDGAMLFDRRTSAGIVFVQAEDGTLFVQAAGGEAVNQFNSYNLVNDDRWHHIAFAFDQSATGSVTLFVDGAQDWANPNSAAWSWPVGQRLELGSSHDAYWQKYDGLLDDVRFYNRALTAAELGQIIATGAVVDSAALKLRLDFDTAPVSGYGVSWYPTFGTLQSAPEVEGPYVDLPGVAAPYPIIPAASREFFRVKN